MRNLYETVSTKICSAVVSRTRSPISLALSEQVKWGTELRVYAAMHRVVSVDHVARSFSHLQVEEGADHAR